MRELLLRHNVGPADRLFRVILGLAILSLAFVGPRTFWGYLGLIPLLTAVVGSCPMYTVFGISTCPRVAKP